MTYAEAVQIIEDNENAEQSYHECRAEAGMGAVSLGLSGYDGMAEYDAAVGGFTPDPRLAEARAYVATAPTVYYVTEDGDVWGPGPVRYVPSHRYRTDDLPF